LRSLWCLGVELASHRLTTPAEQLFLTAVQREEKGTTVSHSKRDALHCREVDDLTCGKRATIIGSAIDRRSHPDIANGFSHKKQTCIKRRQTRGISRRHWWRRCIVGGARLWCWTCDRRGRSRCRAF